MVNFSWRRGVVVIATAQRYSTKPEFSFCAGSNPACGVSEIGDGEDLWQWSWLEIRLNAFRCSTIPQKQFIIINYQKGQINSLDSRGRNQEGLGNFSRNIDGGGSDPGFHCGLIKRTNETIKSSAFVKQPKLLVYFTVSSLLSGASLK